MIKRKNSESFIDYKRVFVTLGLITFFVLLLIFTYSRISHIWRGINLTVSYPISGESIESQLIYIEGSAPKAIELTVNGNSTFVSRDGEFSYPIPVHNGYNEIHIEATDKFDNTTKEILKINGITKSSD
ncbi:MAG: hypothetical protein ACI88L_000042 [Candidatus Paceibacteria bacterium]|jgi:hypothetical protein